MSPDATPHPSNGRRPTVTFTDPLTWSRDYSYEVDSQILAKAGIDLLIPSDPEERDELIKTADAVISSGTIKVTADMIATMGNCVVIQCYSVGMDKVDRVAAAAAGIKVTNANASTADVADHTLALVLALQRRLFPMVEATRGHQWNLRQLPDAWEIRRLEGQVFGIVGAGRIGRLVATRAQAFGFETIAADPYPPEPPVPGLEIVSIEELFSRSDVIAVCAALGDGTRKLINADVLSHTKPGALFVNAARGGLVDEDALVDALDSGRIRMAALDVRDPEPPDPASDKLTHRHDVIVTPHMAAMSERTRSDIHHLVAQNIVSMLAEAGRITES